MKEITSLFVVFSFLVSTTSQAGCYEQSVAHEAEKFERVSLPLAVQKTLASQEVELGSIFGDAEPVILKFDKRGLPSLHLKDGTGLTAYSFEGVVREGTSGGGLFGTSEGEPTYGTLYSYKKTMGNTELKENGYGAVMLLSKETVEKIRARMKNGRPPEYSQAECFQRMCSILARTGITTPEEKRLSGAVDENNVYSSALSQIMLKGLAETLPNGLTKKVPVELIHVNGGVPQRVAFNSAIGGIIDRNHTFERTGENNVSLLHIIIGVTAVGGAVILGYSMGAGGPTPDDL